MPEIRDSHVDVTVRHPHSERYLPESGRKAGHAASAAEDGLDVGRGGLHAGDVVYSSSTTNH